MDESFNAVYYSQSVPSFESLTFMSFIFDKIIFPGVYIPNNGIDEQETIKEIQRIKALGIRDIDDIQLINCMIFSLHNKHLKDICVFTGEFGMAGKLEDGVGELTKALEEIIYGPPPSNFFPTPAMGFAKGLPGDDKAAVNGPCWISYPANALIYASKNGIPLVNDNPTMPVPCLGGASPKSNAKLLSTIMAIECVKFVLPELRTMMPKELAEFRDETKQYVKPFRLSMLKLSKELNSAINSEMSIEDIQHEAKFIVETTVYPELEDLKRNIKDPSKPWYKRTVNLVQDAPELASSFTTLPWPLAVARTLIKVCTVLSDVQEDHDVKNQKYARTGLSYLLRIKGYQEKTYKKHKKSNKRKHK